MSSIRQNILTKLVSDIALVTIAHGYNNNAPVATVVVSDIQDTNPPAIQVVIGEEVRTQIEAGTEGKIDAYILVHCKSATDNRKAGLLTTEVETWISDIDRLFACGNAGSNFSQLHTVQGVSNFYISKISPPLDWKDNKGLLVITLFIETQND